MQSEQAVKKIKNTQFKKNSSVDCKQQKQVYMKMLLLSTRLHFLINWNSFSTEDSSSPSTLLRIAGRRQCLRLIINKFKETCISAKVKITKT